MSVDARRHSPAAERNREPIAAELHRLLPARGSMLEIASGTGQHAAHVATAMHGWSWQPSDGDERALASIDAWCEGLANVHPALRLDVMANPWDGLPATVDALFCANLLHISPWATCAALMRGAAHHLAASGSLLLYGPFIVDGEPTVPSNLAFDADLRARDPAWGLRRLGEVALHAQHAGLHLRERVAMPANNLLLVFDRVSAADSPGLRPRRAGDPPGPAARA